MRTAKHTIKQARLRSEFADLVREMAPSAIMNQAQLDRTLAMIDRLMAAGKLSRGQSLYLETLVQLVQAYEASHHAIHTGDLNGIAMLKHLLDESGLSAADLARLLGVHVSMGSKILKGERSLTVDHIAILADRFKVTPDVFIDRRRGNKAA